MDWGARVLSDWSLAVRCQARCCSIFWFFKRHRESRFLKGSLCFLNSVSKFEICKNPGQPNITGGGWGDMTRFGFQVSHYRQTWGNDRRKTGGESLVTS